MEGPELVNSLRQLVISFEPYLRNASSYEQAQEVLLNLEAHDENFHRYQFVSQLRAKIDESLGGLIEDEFERFSMSQGSDVASDQKTVVQKVTDQVLKSREFENLTHYLRTNVSQAAQTLQNNFEQEFGSGRHGPDFEDVRDKRHSNEMDANMSFSSSYPGSLMFMNQDQAQKLAEELDPHRSLEDRQCSLHTLCSLAPLDVVASDQWSDIRRGLLAALEDPDLNLATKSLKFIAQGFSTVTSQTKELYLLLVDYLVDLCKKNLSRLKNGVDVRKSEHIRIIRSFRLLNEFQLIVPSYWIRCPEILVEQVIESTLKLFSMQHVSTVASSVTNIPMTALHLMALIDPKAMWFNKWMHGSYSRIPLLQKLDGQKKIIENAVKHCLEFTASRKIPFDLMSDISDTLSRVSNSDGHRMHYTRHEMDYIYFIHSLNLLGKLLCHKEGRKFFPIKVKDISEPISITKFLCSLIQLIVDPGNLVTVKYNPVSQQFDPGILVTDMLKVLCIHHDVTILCKDEVTNTLLSPISHWLDDEDTGGHACPESAYLHIADILAQLAASSQGRQHLLYGEGQDRFTRTKSSAAHIIADFAKKAINYDLPGDFAAPPSTIVTGSFVYICRQLYNTCEGLLAMNAYELHTTLAEALNEVSRELDMASTPTPGSDSGSDIDDPKKLSIWSDTLKDNLLNFAATPKGVLLLQQTHTMPECVSYMYSRYRNKLQVSKCEKFGYGTMVSQLAATAAGMVALRQSGFIQSIINNTWTVLECGLDDSPVFHGKIWAVEPVYKDAHKQLINLLKVLTSYAAVYEVLHEQPLPSHENYTFRQMPNTVIELIDRLVFVDKDIKIHSLFNYEQSHVFGLRMFGIIMSCLDTFLLIQSQYKIQEMLLSCQEANSINDRDIILDMLSFERNYILVKTYLIGGPSERVIPPRSISEDSSVSFPYPLFSTYPVPREYVPNVAGRSAMKQVGDSLEVPSSPTFSSEENELSHFLHETKNSVYESDWMERCRKTFGHLLETKPEQAKGHVMQELLEKVLESATNKQDEMTFPLITYSGTDSSLRSFNLTPVQELGVKIAVRYGMHLKLLNSGSDASENLTHLLKQCGHYLQQQQRGGSYSTLRFLRTKTYPGFDWFASTIFLLMNGNLDRSWRFLYQFSMLIASGYLWLPRLHRSVHMPTGLMTSGILPVFSSTGHNVELVLQSEFPLIYSAFRMSGYNVAQICENWLRQCFWNYLDWMDIVHYICVCILMGIDYQVYMCVAILKHMQQDILQHLQEQDLIIFLKEEPLRGFRVGEHLNFMKQLEKKFRKTILSDMQNISKP